jgi:hypothetical protein
MTRLERKLGSTSDPRTQVTDVIWGCAVGMFALCIPLAALNRGALIVSAAVALGAGAGTVAVWRSDPHSRRRLGDEQTVRSLEERIANLEAIASHSELEIQHPFKQLELQKYDE